MSRKKTQPKKNIVPDPKFNSTIIPKLINSIMYDGKKTVAEKIIYEAIDKSQYYISFLIEFKPSVLALLGRILALVF